MSVPMRRKTASGSSSLPCLHAHVGVSGPRPVTSPSSCLRRTPPDVGSATVESALGTYRPWATLPDRGLGPRTGDNRPYHVGRTRAKSQLVGALQKTRDRPAQVRRLERSVLGTAHFDSSLKHDISRAAALASELRLRVDQPDHEDLWNSPSVVHAFYGLKHEEVGDKTPARKHFPTCGGMTPKSLLLRLPPTDERKLCEACDHGDIARVREILSLHANPEACAPESSDRPLHVACKANRFEIVRLFIDDTQVNRQSCGEFGNNALHVACRHGHAQLAEYLISVNVDVERRRTTGDLTPLMLAVHGNHVHIVDCLLRNGAAVDTAGRAGSALSVACGCDGYDRDSDSAIEIIELLVTAGANKEQRCGRGLTPLMLAAEGSDESVVELLVAKGCNSRAVTTKGLMAWQLAQSRDRSFTEMLRKAADAAQGRTADRSFKEMLLGAEVGAVLEACRNGDLVLVRRLLDSGVSAEAISEIDGDRPLHVSAQFSQTEVVKHLLEVARVERSSRGSLNRTALHFSCGEGHLELTEYLLAAGVDANLRDSESLTPLIAAVLGSHVQVVELFVAGSAAHAPVDIEAQTFKGTALHVAASSASAGGGCGGEQARGIIRLLVQARANLEAEFDGGTTPLMVAAEGSDELTVELLLDLGCTKRAKNADGLMPWQLAEKKHNGLALLLKSGLC